MARIRTIKPELPQSETVGRLSREARLLFVLLFTVVDDAGRARAASRLLASLLYPYDDDAAGLIDGWLQELVDERQVVIYEAGGSRYLEIVKWLEHQKIDRPSASKLPAPPEQSSHPREDSRGLDADLVSGPVPVSGPSTGASACRFEEFWEAYPKRDGDNPKLPAKMKFDALVKTGVDPQTLIDGAKAYADEARRKGQIGTQYIAHALKWLTQQRWADAAAAAFVASEGLKVVTSKVFVVVGTPGFLSWDTENRRAGGRGLPITQHRVDNVVKDGWWCDSEFHPDWDEATGERHPPKSDEAAA